MLKSLFFSFLLAVVLINLSGCDDHEEKDFLRLVKANTFTLKCQLLPQKIFSHTYVIEEGANRISEGASKKYTASFTSEEITWREDYPASAKSYGIHTINRSTGVEKIIFFSSVNDEKEGEEDYGCEKIEHKF